MTRRSADTPPIADVLLSTGEHAPSQEDKLRYLRDYRSHSPDRDLDADRTVVQLLEHLQISLRKTEDRAKALSTDLRQIQETQEKLKELVDTAYAAPWYPALYQQEEATEDGLRARVAHNGSSRVVRLSDEINRSDLKAGDEVFLSHELNFIVGKSHRGARRYGETAVLEHRTSDGRLVLKQRDEELVVDAGPLQELEIQPGDRVRWDRSAWMALEKLPTVEGQEYLLKEVPEILRSTIGGQDHNIETLITTLIPMLAAPEKAQRYGLGGRRSILLYGPPGNGKTSMAQLAASELASLTGVKCRFGVVKPAEWESPWVGETQANIRRCFKALRDAAHNGFAVLFLDEIEAVGRVRGGVNGQHSDKFLAALLAEIDGFAKLTNFAIIAATNRKDMVDPALLERLSDVEIEVKRPDMQGAREIFAVHLPETLLFNPNGSLAAHTRREMIETAVSRFYSPNANNEIAVLRFRDGKQRVVSARELASGRLFQQIAEAAGNAALVHDTRGGEPGLRVCHIEDALSDTIHKLASTLKIHNARAYLQDLPQDVDVVSVEPIVHKTVKPHRYLNVA